MLLTTTLGDLRAEILSALRDPAGNRYNPARVLGWLVEALNLLAGDGDFERTDVFEVSAGEAVFQLGGVPVLVHQVSFNGYDLSPADEASLFREYGNAWRGKVGFPKRYLRVGRFGLRIIPTPQAQHASTAIAYNGPTSRTEEQYRGMEARRRLCTIREGGPNDGDFVLWEDGDGQVTNADSADFLLRVRYAYQPLALTEATAIEQDVKPLLTAYALWKEMERSRREDELVKAPAYKAEWQSLRLLFSSDLGPVGVSTGINLIGACG
jgi:hypothetical protein